MTIRVAVVGLGWAGRSIWLSALREHPEYEVVAAVDPAPIARATAQREAPGTPVLASTAELTPAGVDLAIVAVPNHMHSSVACGLLHAGIPVFVEKPVCLTAAEADDLANAERAGGAVLLAGSAARYRGDVRALRELISAQGSVRHVDLAWVRASGVPVGDGWFVRRSLSGGGALVDLGWHLLDTFGHLVGPVGFTQVVGAVSDDFVKQRTSRATWRYDQPQEAESDVEDTARGFLVSTTGVSVSLRASWASHEANDVTSVVVESSGGTAELRCTFGFSPNRIARPTLTVTRDGETEEIELAGEPIGIEYRRQLDEIPALLADPGSRGRAIDDVRGTIAVIERLYESARTRAVAA
ncbi:Gfo/Idh/MocA family oxidoreductase [Lentzea tibetensis]|uniref:Gfo/Idh/MocA family oxidoreductase n=1 Tax=Lentzea tibetensis TaxID=2591470 RepID=A0A563EJU1_9PSEU|nr:Gfo/Idh/MocA family oxidoreductase [Lentzea tibetensis]TWP46946.1 Gfo/Idh/MocA family oxidoreductase [Lentzea tibetensis]